MPAGKKAAAKGQPKSAQEQTQVENEGPVLTGVFATDLPLLCGQEGLPPVAVRTLNSPPAAERSGECVTTEQGDVPSRYSVLVDYENDDDTSALKTLHIRGWLVSEGVANVLTEALSGSQLTSLNLWNAGLNAITLPIVTRLVQQTNVRKLVLDANLLKTALPISELLKSKSTLEQLSLKCCQLSDARVLEFTQALTDNKTLLGLDLSCNHIGDEGACGIATGLRLNRTLLSLGLANNDIGDAGASSLAEVVSRFALNHSEIVLWRKLSSGHRRLESGLSSLDIERGRESSPRRSPSVVSIDKSVRGSGKDKTTVKGKKAEPKKDDKAKKDDKIKKDAKKTKGKDSKASKKGPDIQLESPKPEPSEAQNPLADPQCVKKEGDKIYLIGATNLVFLTLAYNKIKEKGVRSLLEAVTVQQHYSHLGPGLLKLTIHHNPVSSEYSELKELNSLLEKKDPLQQPDPMSPGMEPDQDES